MTDFRFAYIPIGVPTFHMESAHEQFEMSVEMLKRVSPHGIYPDKPLLTINELRDFIKDLAPDLVILQNTTFANSAYTAELVRATRCPILLWTLREPVIDGGRLRLNSLTGAYSAGNLLTHTGRGCFEYVYGSPGEGSVVRRISAVIKAAKVKKSLGSLTMACIGVTPQGFGFGRALDAEMMKHFGVNLISIESREIMNRAKGYKKEDYADLLEEARKKTSGLDELPEGNVDSFARLYKAHREFIQSNNIGALASRCWPDYFVEFGTPVCAVLGMLNDDMVPAACEADAMGALSMYTGMILSESPVFFGDPVSLDEGGNTITYWHCGTAACSLARKDTGAKMGVHPNRQIGPTMEFGCRPAEHVTVFRIGRTPRGEYRFFIARGEALDVPKQFCGTTIVVKMENRSLEIVEKSVKDGWEPHFAVIYGDIADELGILANFLEMEAYRY